MSESDDKLSQLGLIVRRTATGVEADLPLETDSVFNPLTKARIERASFMVLADRLMALDPPEFVGLPPVSMSDFDTPDQLRSWVIADFKRMLAELERRSADLRKLGVEPRIDAETLHLTAEILHGDARFEISSDKRGNFRLARAMKANEDFQVSGTQTFELSDLGDRSSLLRHLYALVGLPPAADEQAPSRPAITVGIGDVARVFGPHAMVPPKSALELLVELRVRGQIYRFAAARVEAQTFRGLLAGPKGKLWADRFELGTFAGVKALAAQVLNVQESEIEFPRALEGAQ